MEYFLSFLRQASVIFSLLCCQADAFVHILYRWSGWHFTMKLRKRSNRAEVGRAGWKQQKHMGQRDLGSRSTWDTRTWAAGVGMWKTHQLSKRIQSGVASLGIKVERYRAQGGVWAFWLLTIWKSWVKLLESRVECQSLCYNLSVQYSSLVGTTIWILSTLRLTDIFYTIVNSISYLDFAYYKSDFFAQVWDSLSLTHWPILDNRIQQGALATNPLASTLLILPGECTWITQPLILHCLPKVPSICVQRQRNTSYSSL